MAEAAPGTQVAQTGPDAVVAEGLSKSYVRKRGRPFPFLRSRKERDRTRDVDDDEDEDLVEEVDEDLPTPGRTTIALQDVSFRIPSGATLGVIGRAGSGKTTLLKIIARITPPTSGRVIVRGRVLPLIELATSFVHGDMDARANVLQLARLFGVPRREAERQLAEIIRLAELDDRLHEKASRFSSGMVRRLAFSTVLGLQPDVLLVDDVLGADGEFRERCLERIGAAAAAGTTTIFVSHDLAAVHRLSDSVLWIEGGAVVELGPPDAVLRAYARSSEVSPPPTLSQGEGHRGSPGEARIVEKAARARAAKRQRSNEYLTLVSAGVVTTEGGNTEIVRVSEPASVRIILAVNSSPVDVRCGVALSTEEGLRIRILQDEPEPLEPQKTYAVTVPLRPEALAEGRYIGRVGAFVRHAGVQHAISSDPAFALDVYDAGASKDGAEPSEEDAKASDEAEGAAREPLEIQDADWSFEPIEQIQ